MEMSHYTTLACVCVNMRRGQFTLPIVPSVWPVCDTYVGVIDNLWLCESSIKIDHADENYFGGQSAWDVNCFMGQSA